MRNESSQPINEHEKLNQEQKEIIKNLDNFEPTGKLSEDFSELTKIRGKKMFEMQFDSITGKKYFDESDDSSLYNYFKSLEEPKIKGPLEKANADAFYRMLEAYEQKENLK